MYCSTRAGTMNKQWNAAINDEYIRFASRISTILADPVAFGCKGTWAAINVDTIVIRTAIRNEIPNPVESAEGPPLRA